MHLMHAKMCVCQCQLSLLRVSASNYTTLVRADLTRVTSKLNYIQAVPVLSSLYPSLISFSYFTFPGVPYRIFLLFLPWLPCHFYLVVIEQQHS